MKDMMEELKIIFTQAAADDFAEYREVIELCEKRNTAEEGIPAIIGLDDLTGSGRTVFEGAPMDRSMRYAMVADALIFNWLYSQQEGRDPHYPSIAPAMSALAEKRFCIDEGEEAPCSYREALEKA